MILLVEDDNRFAELVIEYLEQHGYQLDYANDSKQALNLIEKFQYQLIILDINLPQLDGIEVCKKIRFKDIKVPCLVLTARTSLEDKIHGFEAGADDYLVKPFALPELVARMNALMMRYNQPIKQKQQLGDLIIDWTNIKASRGDVQLLLNATDWLLLKIFASNPHRPISQTEISNTLWGDSEPSSNAIKMAIYRFRKAINPINPIGLKPLVITVRSQGYVFYNK